VGAQQFRAGSGLTSMQLTSSAEEPLRDYSSNGDAVHHGNTILGLLALQAGEIETAGKYLIESAKTEGSPVLNSFGPSMLLAKALLEAGQKDKVLEYFELCEKFWMPSSIAPGNKLNEWKDTVAADGIPDFGSSLLR